LFHRKPTDLHSPILPSGAGCRVRAQATPIERRHAIIYPLAALCFPNFVAAMPQAVTIGASATELTKRFPAFIA
jgi:hypothetical protein